MLIFTLIKFRNRCPAVQNHKKMAPLGSFPSLHFRPLFGPVQSANTFFIGCSRARTGNGDTHARRRRRRRGRRHARSARKVEMVARPPVWTLASSLGARDMDIGYMHWLSDRVTTRTCSESHHKTCRKLTSNPIIIVSPMDNNQLREQETVTDVDCIAPSSIFVKACLS